MQSALMDLIRSSEFTAVADPIFASLRNEILIATMPSPLS